MWKKIVDKWKKRRGGSTTVVQLDLDLPEGLADEILDLPEGLADEISTTIKTMITKARQFAFLDDLLGKEMRSWIGKPNDLARMRRLVIAAKRISRQYDKKIQDKPSRQEEVKNEQ